MYLNFNASAPDKYQSIGQGRLINRYDSDPNLPQLTELPIIYWALLLHVPCIVASDSQASKNSEVKTSWTPLSQKFEAFGESKASRKLCSNTVVSKLLVVERPRTCNLGCERARWILAAIVIQTHHFPALISIISLKSVPDQRSQDRKAVDNTVNFCFFDCPSSSGWFDIKSGFFI